MRKLVEKFSITYDNDIIIMIIVTIIVMMITMAIIINNDDNDIDWEVEQDQEVCHGLEAHHPKGRDVLVELLNATHLLLWERLFQ